MNEGKYQHLKHKQQLLKITSELYKANNMGIEIPTYVFKWLNNTLIEVNKKIKEEHNQPKQGN